ncbi:MAG: hypothetical protein ACXWDI_06820, partial [Nocardioides sp.]
MSAPTLQPVSPAQRPLVERLWQHYANDLSQFRGSMPDADGLFRPGRLPLYFEDPDRTVHLIAAAGEPAGFAMHRLLDGDTRVLASLRGPRRAPPRHRPGHGPRAAHGRTGYQGAGEPAGQSAGADSSSYDEPPEVR